MPAAAKRKYLLVIMLTIVSHMIYQTRSFTSLSRNRLSVINGRISSFSSNWSNKNTSYKTGLARSTCLLSLSNISSQFSSSSKNILLEILNNEPIITSTKSKTVKLYQSISSKSKVRSEQQMTILEGHRLIIDTLAHNSHLYRDVLVTREALSHPKLGEKLIIQLENLINGNQSCRIRLAEQNVVNAACDTITPQGVVALTSIPQPYEFTPSNTDNGKNTNNFFLILDGISDPGNVGTLLRSAKATGVEAVIVLPNCCDLWNPKAVRSAMGTTFQVPIRSFSSWEECLSVMSTWGITGKDIFAATMEGSRKSNYENDRKEFNYESVAHYDVDWFNSKYENKALIIGKEGTGLSNHVREAVSNGMIRSVHVPMEQGIESLNAAVCGSVVMFEYHRQRRIK